ncbi:MAG: YceI family protein [Deltaproteobacteria bacterium]|nr:YceI family protein [Deltaproteobacteria bacterium]
MKTSAINGFRTGAPSTGMGTIALILSTMALFMGGSGCSPGGKDTVSNEAQTTETVKVNAESESHKPSPSGTLKLSPENTTIAFLGKKLVGSHEGSFNAFSGAVSFKDGDPTTAKVDVKIDMSSVRTDEEKLDAHLKSADFFDVEKFQSGTFVSTSVTGGGTGDATHTVKGKLTLRGVTKPIAIPAKINVGRNSVSMAAEVVINRQDFGISFPGMPDNLIKDEVKIFLKIDGQLK